MIEKRPPRVSWDSVPFWEACDRGELTLDTCVNCGEINWFPRELCVKCGSAERNWVLSEGRGVVESYSHVFRPMNESYADEVPYVLALVRINEGPLFITRIVGDGAMETGIGDSVEARFQPTDGHSLPVFVRCPVS